MDNKTMSQETGQESSFAIELTPQIVCSLLNPPDLSSLPPQWSIDSADKPKLEKWLNTKSMIEKNHESSRRQMRDRLSQDGIHIPITFGHSYFLNYILRN